MTVGKPMMYNEEDTRRRQRVHLILLQVPSDHEHPLPVSCCRDLLNTADTLETLECGAVLRQHDVDLQTITDLV